MKANNVVHTCRSRLRDNRFWKNFTKNVFKNKAIFDLFYKDIDLYSLRK